MVEAFESRQHPGAGQSPRTHAPKRAGIEADLYWESESLHVMVVLDGAFHDDPYRDGR